MRTSDQDNVHIVPKIKRTVRMQEYCGPVFAALGSRSAAKKAIKAGRVFINGRAARTSDLVKPGDKIELRGSLVSEIKKYHMAVDVVHEDDHLLVVNKPGGIASNGNRYKTVENAVADANKNLRIDGALPRPVAVHRIDVPTNGLLVLARTKQAQIVMGRAFQQNAVKKTYVAIVHGSPPLKGTVDSPVDGKKALTHFETIRTVPSRKFGALSLLNLSPVTGRTHQLRIHMRSIGHLIVGDKMYAEDTATILGKGVLLCASRIRFEHPISGAPLDLAIDPPAKFLKLLDREEQRF